MSINIGSTAEWQTLLSSTNVVVADFYADWCGPCKMIAPHFEKLANEYSRPKKVAFAKVNVDSQSAISRSQGVSAMPTFKIFHGGNCIETIKGANPPALAQAVTNAIKLGDAGKPGDSFKTPGRKLGGESLSQQPAARGRPSIPAIPFNPGGFLNALVAFVGLYLVSLFSFDPYKAAEKSIFNIKRPVQPSQGSGAKVKAPAQKPVFKTLADLGGE